MMPDVEIHVWLYFGCNFKMYVRNVNNTLKTVSFDASKEAGTEVHAEKTNEVFFHVS
jgi:hypothetical protein